MASSGGTLVLRDCFSSTRAMFNFAEMDNTTPICERKANIWWIREIKKKVIIIQEIVL